MVRAPHHVVMQHNEGYGRLGGLGLGGPKNFAGGGLSLAVFTTPWLPSGWSLEA